MKRLHKLIHDIRSSLACLVAAAVAPAACVLTSCGAEPPDNRQPVIEIVQVGDITRTEAVVTVNVQQNGATPLSHLSLFYGTSEAAMQKIDATGATAGTFTVQLTGLRPGTTYTCYAEGGTASASVRSAAVTFATDPNTAPSLSAPTFLSTGPVGVIVSFDIDADGGEALLHAGCEIADVAAGTIRRVYLDAAGLTIGTHRLSIPGLTPHTAYRLRAFAENPVGETISEAVDHTTADAIILADAGALATVLDGNIAGISALNIAGPMNGDDFAFMRMLFGAPLLPGQEAVKNDIVTADLTDVSIREGGTSYDGNRYTVTDRITTGLLADCERLQALILPSSATVMERDAVASCTALRTLTVPAAVNQLLPSAGCAALTEIKVPAACENYASEGGVLYNHAVTEILWFPLGKTGAYTLPPTLTAIGENAFAGTSLTELVIPPSVKTIGRGAFAGSALKDITLPDNLANVSEAMFQGSAHLSTVHLGAGTLYIGDYAFDGTAITALYVAAETPPYTATNAFFNGSETIFAGCTLYVPAGCGIYYRNHARWSLFHKIVEY